MQINVQVQWRHLAVAAIVMALGVLLWRAAPALSQTAAPDPVATFAFVARADNPVDALAAGAVAGQLGAPVYLTGRDGLGDQARQGLQATDPQVVVLAGGTAALSQAVEDEVRAALPGAQLRRMSGQERTETARLVSDLTGELGVERPVLAGATVAGDVGIDGSLTLDGTDVGAALAALTARVDALEATLAGVERTGDVLTFTGMNLQLVNGAGTTATSNGLGNLIVGYNAPRATTVQRSGSHFVVVGDEHEWRGFGGLVAGLNNTVNGSYASVTGGRSNTANRGFASVTGGLGNTASGEYSSVSGGRENVASKTADAVAGGFQNTASGGTATVAGGRSNRATGGFASVAGGDGNTASGFIASVAGGGGNTASGGAVAIAGGNNGTVANSFDSLIGNTLFPDS